MIKKFSKNKTLGFTLVELLVVVSIVGFLASSTMVLIRFTQIRARNAKRNGDIVQLIKAFQLIADDNNGVFPSTTGGSATGRMICVSTDCCCGFKTGQIHDDIIRQLTPYTKQLTDINEFSFYGYYYQNTYQYGPDAAGPYLIWQNEDLFGETKSCGLGHINYAGWCIYKLE